MTHALYDLLEELDSRRLYYSLSRHRIDSVLVSLTLPGKRIEIDVFNDGRLEMSQFSGDESVIDDRDEIFRIVNDASSG
ncbi:hypothetical protein [Paraburkholderia fungorum]|jgi:hypothetical protein|uniref:Uncharacterized protein n=1 Tax=Paraburkholderia fungorum TaxID=134537 RepID=A0AAJ4CG90_9BURK|nr:hypothetical protein [Paraburkholderia fungorum]AJZ60363.1 hypothetical protein OI25_3571 [Paraburkholderia fungorum]MBB5544736.1 hypothetical protein [Paraburkholderia fungorum]MBU7443055.1 hypothetical protein [Paraburkholderia fungorum]MDT8841187.1 hypothetical protein [Paraburkholderia fungorum]PNE56091.1 hypothetical protein A8H39_09635 [Paraburkholderia fungorum]